MKKSSTKRIIVYQSPSGAIELRGDVAKETIWATQAQMATIFGVNSQAITKHLKNIYGEDELSKRTTCSNLEQVQIEGKRTVRRVVEFYSLDAIISVGYRISSTAGTRFRQWATKTLRSYVVDGYVINKKRIARNYDAFLAAIESVKKFLPTGGQVKAEDALELIKIFAFAWFSLDAYDKSYIPKTSATKNQLRVTADELARALHELKQELVAKKEASELFGTERSVGAVSGIVGNIFQSFGGNDLYVSVEEKAAHILYFLVKNHPFTDGNKRSGAFAFVWFLRKMGKLNTAKITPGALTTLTLLVAESSPRDKERLIGLILLLLRE